MGWGYNSLFLTWTSVAATVYWYDDKSLSAPHIKSGIYYRFIFLFVVVVCYINVLFLLLCVCGIIKVCHLQYISAYFANSIEIDYTYQLWCEIALYLIFKKKQKNLKFCQLFTYKYWRCTFTAKLTQSRDILRLLLSDIYSFYCNEIFAICHRKQESIRITNNRKQT